MLFALGGTITYLFCLFFITPKYESSTTIFTANTHANIHLVSAGIRFGYDKEIGEQLEILNSSAVREDVIKEFDLRRVYNIDTTDQFWREDLLKMYNKNINMERTVNKSIVISVRDIDPERAAAIANRIVTLADEHKSKIVQENVKSAAEAALASFESHSHIVNEMSDSLEALRQAGEAVWTFGEERKSGRFTNYELQYRRELNRLMDLKGQWEQLDDLLKADIPKSYVVSSAYPAGKPVYPKKGLLSILGGTLAVLVYLSLLRINASTKGDA